MPSGDTGAGLVGENVGATVFAGATAGSLVGVARTVGKGEIGTVLPTVARAVGVLVGGIAAVGLVVGTAPPLQAAARVASAIRLKATRRRHVLVCVVDIIFPSCVRWSTRTVWRNQPPQPQPGAGLLLVGVGEGTARVGVSRLVRTSWPSLN